MALQINSLVIDARDPRRLAGFWSAALDWPIIGDDGDEVMIAPGTSPADLPGAFPFLFGRGDDARVGKNRLHLDLVPDDRDAEVARLEALGATRVEIGQSDDPDTTWVVLADPEGNEFCVLRSYAG